MLCAEVARSCTTSTVAGVTTNYDYTGPRNEERLIAGGTAFLNGSLGITNQSTAGATTSFIRDPYSTFISMRTNTGASHYYTTDTLCSTILLTDTTQAAATTHAYDSWGNATATGAQTAVNPWTYAGGYNDTTNGLVKFGARYYNPAQGRFTQPDPSGQEQNRYTYASCNPLNATGLDGWGCVVDWFGLMGGVFGFGGGVLAAPPTAGGSALLAFAGTGTVISGIDALKNGCY